MRGFRDIAPYLGLSFGAGLSDQRIDTYGGGTLVTLVDHAVSLARRADSVVVGIKPSELNLRVGRTFQVQLEANAGRQPVDGVALHFDYDPAILVPVDADGRRTNEAVVGLAWTNVITNHVDADRGRVDFVATGDPISGRHTAATLWFRTEMGQDRTTLDWSLAEPRRTRVTSAGGDVLDAAEGARATIGSSSFLAGKADLEGSGEPGPAWQVPLVLAVGRPGDPGPSDVTYVRASSRGTFDTITVVNPRDSWVAVDGFDALRSVVPSRGTRASGCTISVRWRLRLATAPETTVSACATCR